MPQIEQWMRDAAKQILTYLNKPCTCKQCEVDATDIIASEFAKYECEHEFGMFDVCQKCGYYGGHQPGAVEAHDPATPAYNLPTPELLKELKWAEPLLMKLCGVALNEEVQDFLPSGLLDEVKAWLQYNDAQAAMRVAEAAPTTPHKRLMITKGGEIHEECPDCRGASCSPYQAAGQGSKP